MAVMNHVVHMHMTVVHLHTHMVHSHPHMMLHMKAAGEGAGHQKHRKRECDYGDL